MTLVASEYRRQKFKRYYPSNPIKFLLCDDQACSESGRYPKTNNFESNTHLPSRLLLQIFAYSLHDLTFRQHIHHLVYEKLLGSAAAFKVHLYDLFLVRKEETNNFVDKAIAGLGLRGARSGRGMAAEEPLSAQKVRVAAKSGQLLLCDALLRDLAGMAC